MAFRKPAPQYDPRPGKDTSGDPKDISSNSLAFLTHSMPSRHRSGSTASTRSTRSTKDEQKASTVATPLNATPVSKSNALLPPLPLLPHSSDAKQQSHHQHHHIRLPSLFRRRKHSSASTAPLESTSLSPSSTSTLQLSLQQHTIVMVSEHDIHITWPHPVPSGNVFIAGTWCVPGHKPWDKLPMTRIAGTDSFEVHLDVQETEDISDYLDEDGYLHHELLDNHHAHDHPHQDSPPLTPSSATTTSSSPLSRRKRISRFFGRARSSSSASATSTTPSKDLHVDLPYHHQSKDGTFLPLAREYHYQYKFVVDDEWKCDHAEPQVQDPHGHWNHELVVKLVEQTSLDAAGGRSRSGSLQSQHGPQVGEHSLLNKSTAHPTITTTTSDSTMTSTATTTTTTNIDTPTSIIISPAEEDGKKEIEVIPQETNENVAVLTPVPASSSVTVAAVPAAPIPTSTTTRRGNLKSRDTFEAVLIFDETDDLSDGEGRSKHQEQVESDDEDDEDEEVAVNEDTNKINNAIVDTFDISNNNNNENVLLGDEDVVKLDVTPQQDEHASLSPADQDLEKPSVVIKASAADAAADAIPASASLVEAIVSSDNDHHAEETAREVKSIEVVTQAVEEDSAIAAIEDVFVNSSSVAESLPQLDEPSIIIPAESRVEEEEEEQQEETVAPAPIIVEEAKVEPEAEVEKITIEPETEVEKVTVEPEAEVEKVTVEPEAEVEKGTVEPEAEVEKATVEPEAEVEKATVEPEAEVEKATVEPEAEVEKATVEPEAEVENVTLVERTIEAETPAAPSPAPASVAIPASPVFSFSSSVNSHLLSPGVEPESFVLQAAVNLEENPSNDDDDVSEVDELESSIQEIKPTATTKAALEVVTDAAAIATATAIATAATATAATVSVNTTATDYSQVPSPPLTPSTMTSSKRDLITEEIASMVTEIESEKHQQQEENFERSVYMTPRAETSFTKHTTLEETTTTTTPHVEDENATIDILEDKDLPTSLLSGSSSTSSLSTLTESRRSSNSSTSTKHSSSGRKFSSSLEEGKSREVKEHDHDKKQGLPEQYPNLFWSICKTTAVVSAAVVVLGLGIGRKRD